MRSLNIVADGDSWNDYPRILLTHGGLADHLSDIMGTPILNISHAGDSTEETMGLAKSQRLAKTLPNADILLFSGGGDDIAGDEFYIWLNPNQDGDIGKAINWPRFNAVLDLIIADYESLTEIRDAMAPQCMIVTHSYDWPPAEVMGQGVIFLGPWLQPGLIRRGWMNPNDQAAIVKTMLTTFQTRLSAFAANNRLHIHVNTQGTVAPGDWGNELHLNDSGWTKAAQQINLALLPWSSQISA